MQVEADPNQLRQTASLFSNGAYDLRQKAKRLEDIQSGLVQGQNSWKGEGAQGFSTTMEKIQNEIQQKAGVLEEAAQILIRFAYQMDNVNQIRNQASDLERTLWSISGDSEAVFHERQSISYQINQLQQEAEWQANAADAQATSALNSLSIPMPDIYTGSDHSSGNLEDELEGLSPAERSYYRRHKDLLGDSDGNDSEAQAQPLDRASMTAALVQYLKSKEPDYLPDDIREQAAMQDFNMLYSDLPDDVLAARIHDILDSEKQGQHFQQEIQSGNYDQNALIHESGYTQYAMNQAYQQDPFAGIHGILMGMGIISAFDRGESQTPEAINENTVDSLSQPSQEVQKGYSNAYFSNEVTVNSGDDFVGTLKGEKVQLKGVKTKEIFYTKRLPAETAKLRKEFDSAVRKSFLKEFANDPVKVEKLQTAGLSESDIARMKDGLVPKGWQVHHKLPLDDGGTNSFDNLVLIKNDPYHKVVTNAQNDLTRGLTPEESKTINWPIPDGDIYPPEKD